MKSALLLNSVGMNFEHILYTSTTHMTRCTLRMDQWFITLLHTIAPGKYIAVKVEYGIQLHFKIFLNKSDIKQQQK